MCAAFVRMFECVKAPLGDLPLRRAAGSGAVPRVPPGAAVHSMSMPDGWGVVFAPPVDLPVGLPHVRGVVKDGVATAERLVLRRAPVVW